MSIQPLGEQIIIKTIPQGKVGSIIVPDTAKGITMMGSGNKPVPTDYLISASLLDDLIVAIKPKTTGRRTNVTELLARAETARKTPATNNLSDAVHFVEAEVIAIGTGKRIKDERLVDDLLAALKKSFRAVDANAQEFLDLIHRAESHNRRAPFFVSVGDRILYHPAVQRFDRKVEMEETPEDGGEYYIIREDSVLGVIER